MTDASGDVSGFAAILDPMPGYQRLALIKHGQLTDIWINDLSDKMPAYGSIFMARITSIFPDHNRVQLNIGQMGMASMRVANMRGSKSGTFTAGALIPVTVQAEPREQKPAQMRHGIIRETRFAIIHHVPDTSGQLHLSQRLKAGLANQQASELMDAIDTLRALALAHQCQITLREPALHHPIDMVMANILAHVKALDHVVAESKTITTQGILAPALSLAQIAEQHVQSEHIRIDQDGRQWADADIDQQIDIALSPSLPIPEGGILHISTPPGAAVIDGDSGTSRLSPDALASAMITPLARQIQLRRIAGAIVVDFPRMDHAGKDRIHQTMLDECGNDPLRPICYGWTKGGLYTLDRRHQRRPLFDVLDWHKVPAKHAAIAALRELWQSGQSGQNKDSGNKNGLPPRLHLTQSMQGWLNGDGRAIYDAVCADLPLPLPPERINVQT